MPIVNLFKSRHDSDCRDLYIYGMRESNNLDNFIDFLDKEDTTSQLKQIRDIVSIEEWIGSKYYIGSETDSLFPFWREVIIEFFNTEKNELILTGGIGTGKSTLGDLVIARKLYELSCFQNPALMFNLSQSTVLAFAYLSTTIEQAKEQGFGHLRKIIDSTPYFQEHFPRNKKRDSKIIFPNDVVRIHAGSSERQFIGLNLLGLVLDEQNFVHAGGGEEGRYEKAMTIYRESSNRKKSRFFVNGKEHGVRVLISSSNLETSFVESRIEELRNDSNTLIVNSTIFKVKPENYSKTMFHVYKGNQYVPPFVIDNENCEKYNDICKNHNLESVDVIEAFNFIPATEFQNEIVSIPIDFYSNFKLDPFGSLKEVAGISIKKQGRLMYDDAKYDRCVDRSMKHPFEQEEVTVSTKDRVNQLILNLKPDFYGDSKKKYYFGADLSLSGCPCGLAMGCMDDLTRKVLINLMIRIKPPFAPEQININDIQEFVLFLKDKRNFNITDVVFDGFQSASSIQFFKHLGYKAYTYSIEHDEPYLFLTNKIMSQEIAFYDYPIFKKEFFGLVHQRDKSKVDHTEGMTKDVADAVCRVFNCIYNTEGVKHVQRYDPISALVQMQKKTKKFQEFVNSSLNSKDRILKEEQELIGQPLMKTGR